MHCPCNQKHRISVNAVFRKDPTRTLTLRNQFSVAMKRRFKRLRQLIYQSIVDNDCFGLNIEYEQRTVDLSTIQFKTNAAIPDQQFAFLRDPQKVPAFMQWLQEMDDDIILEILPGQQLGEAVETAWTNTYIQTAYQKGMLRGRQEIKGNSITGYEDIPPYGSEYGSLQKAFNSPFHADKVGLIYTRAYDGLKGITNEMNKQISSVLAQGISEGFGPKDIADRIVERVDKIGITRATILARTEVIRAHHVAMVQEYRNWGVIGVLVQAEWTTAGDSRVCPKCSKLQGKVYTLEEIEPLIPLHPQCRCLALPVDIMDEPVKKEKIPEFIPAESIEEARNRISELFNINDIGQFTGEPLSNQIKLQSINAIGMELQRLEKVTPGISQLTIKPQTAGVAPGRKLTIDIVDNGRNEYAARLNEMNLAPITITGKTPIIGETYSWHSVYDDDLYVFRHEYGHAIHQQGLPQEQFEEWFYIYKGKPVDFWEKNISEYGGVSATELFADSFAEYTSTAYKKGIMPEEVESFFEKILNKKK